MSTDYFTALNTEITTDPDSLGYSGLASDQIAALINTPANVLNPAKSGTGWTKPAPLVALSAVLVWSAQPDTTVNPAAAPPIQLVQAGAANASDPLQGPCQAALIVLQQWATGTLNLADPSILALISSLQVGGKMNANQQAALLALGTTPCSRAESLWGPGFTVSQTDVKRALVT